MFDITGEEFAILIAVAMIVVGPDRMPEYARQFKAWVARARDTVQGAASTVRDEMGDTIDFSTLDPRQYDPRRLAREVLSDAETTAERRAGRATRRRSAALEPGEAPPFDADAT